MARAETSSPISRRARFGVVALVALLHVAALIALVHAFAPRLTATVVEGVTSAFDVTITAPPPTPAPTPTPSPTPSVSAASEQAGAPAPAGKQARPRAASAPVARIVVTRQAAPKVGGTGSEDRSGAARAGEGTGASGQGDGTGGGGAGTGGGGAKAVKLSGDINSSKDYPRKTRELRLGGNVVIVITVGADGKPRACRVHRPSRDPQADAITCDLAMARFRFRPALDGAGRPVESEYGWQQRWFRPGGE